MTRHASIYYIVIAVCLGISLGGCRTKKSIQKTQVDTTVVEKVERHSDSTRTEQRTAERIDITRDENERSYTRTTEFDSSGVVRKVSEEWRDRRSADVAVRDNASETISMTGSEKRVEETDSSYTVIQETKHIQSDSRPVQGFEWFWVIVGGAIILSIVIFFIIRKKKNKWQQ